VPRLPQGAVVIVSRVGTRWKARVFRRDPGGAELVAEVLGRWALVQLVAKESPAILAKTNGREQLLDFLRANGCRVSA
jgi:hypothetical protein